MPTTATTVRIEDFGLTPDGRPIERYVLRNASCSLGILTWGASVQSLVVPDRYGRPADVVLGFDNLSGYYGAHPYLGATVGRFANRIAGGRFELDGHGYQIPNNEGENALHGGAGGFDRKVWSAHEISEGIELRLVSVDGEMGFPGTLEVTTRYLLRDQEIWLEYEAWTTATTVVNLTNHAYFNLAGPGSASAAAHELRISADEYLPVDGALIPLGERASVAGTPMDFRAPKPIGRELKADFEQLRRAKGFDHSWVLTAASQAPAAEVWEPSSGRVLEVHTDQPAVQFYSGQLLAGDLHGKAGNQYPAGSGFCLETQHFPDSPNQPAFPSTVLRPGDTYRARTRWLFSCR